MKSQGNRLEAAAEVSSIPLSAYTKKGGQWIHEGILYALKECYPISVQRHFSRDASGEIVPEENNTEAAVYLNKVKECRTKEHF